LILAGDGDPLSPEGRRYGKMMQDAGVQVELHEFKGTMHGFTHDGSQSAEEAIRLMIDFINREKDRSA
jgi:acetyl esterase/lipase